MNKFTIYLLFLSVLSLSSCLVPRKVTYVNNMSVDSLYRIQRIPELKVQKNDRISIVVSSKTPELAAPFNQEGGLYDVSEKGEVSSRVTGPSSKGYLVNKNGNIDFPILGSIHVEGLTIDEIKSMLQNRLISEKYINEPVVSVEMINLRVMMMGEVNGVGMLNIEDGELNLLEAITQSGGLTNNAESQEITVIREEDGNRKMYTTNIENTELFNSPVFNLKQNDIVYVKPKSAVMTPRQDLSWRYIGMFTSILALSASIIAIGK